jgi:hypothetical protein
LNLGLGGLDNLLDSKERLHYVPVDLEPSVALYTSQCARQAFCPAWSYLRQQRARTGTSAAPKRECKRAVCRRRTDTPQTCRLGPPISLRRLGQTTTESASAAACATDWPLTSISAQFFAESRILRGVAHRQRHARHAPCNTDGVVHIKGLSWKVVGKS